MGMEHVTFSYFLLRCVSWNGKEKTSHSCNFYHPFFFPIRYLITVFVVHLVSGDNANTLKDMPTKGGREEKEQVSATTTTTATPTTSLAVVDSSDNEVVTENLWKEEKLANDDESEAGQQSTIRNTSDARGIFSNMVKTINKCKCPTLIEFFCEYNCSYSATLLLTIRGERKENHW